MRQQQDQHDAWLDSTFERRCSWERWIIGWDAAMGHDKFGYFKKLLQAPLKQESVKHALFLIVSSQWCYSSLKPPGIESIVWFLKSLKQQKHWAGPLWILKLGKVRLWYGTLAMVQWASLARNQLLYWGLLIYERPGQVTLDAKGRVGSVTLDVFNEALDGHISRGHWHALRRGKAKHFVLYTVFFYVIFPSVCVS